MPHDLGIYKALTFLPLLPSSYTPKGVVYPAVYTTPSGVGGIWNLSPQVGSQDGVLPANLGLMGRNPFGIVIVSSRVA